MNDALTLRDNFIEIRYDPSPLFVDNVGAIIYSFRKDYSDIHLTEDGKLITLTIDNIDEENGQIIKQDAGRIGITTIWQGRIIKGSSLEPLDVFFERAGNTIERVTEIIKPDSFRRMGLRSYYILQLKDLVDARDIYQTNIMDYSKPPLSGLEGSPKEVFSVIRVGGIQAEGLEQEFNSSIKLAITVLNKNQSTDYCKYQAGLLIDIDSFATDDIKPEGYRQILDAIKDINEKQVHIIVEAMLKRSEGNDLSSPKRTSAI
jgi:hypothetical protein